jgi:hypothetical protein
MDGRLAIVAADITKGNELLKLREDKGIARLGVRRNFLVGYGNRVITIAKSQRGQ